MPWTFCCRHMPGHASREVLIVMGSLTTCDPDNIISTISVSGHTVCQKNITVVLFCFVGYLRKIVKFHKQRFTVTKIYNFLYQYIRTFAITIINIMVLFLCIDQMLREANVRCSVIGLAAEVCVCKKLCKETHGKKYNLKK